MISQIFHSPGKLLLTGEYVVLDGAKALAIPTKYGQSLEVVPIPEGCIKWQSIDHKGTTWFKETFEIKDLVYESLKNPFSDTLQNILRTAKGLHSEFLQEGSGFSITTQLDFPRDWGLGTSSTLIHNIASWAKIDAHLLLQKSFGGSGYDVAVAAHKAPILYQLEQNQPMVTPITLDWDFTQSLHFVHLNQKQDSKDGIKRYENTKRHSTIDLDVFSEITEAIIGCTSLSGFSELLSDHETRISKVIDMPTIKTQLFPDFKGTIKSLGAWGGDFVLAVAAQEYTHHYFKQKGFDTVIPFDEMIL